MRGEDEGSWGGKVKGGTITGMYNVLEKEMATHSAFLARRIPQIEEAGGLQAVGSQRVGHD